MSITRLNHVVPYVSDLARSVDVYPNDTLGELERMAGVPPAADVLPKATAPPPSAASPSLITKGSQLRDQLGGLV
jgi:hypothetical protein